MYVRVNQPRQKRAIAQVECLRACRMLHHRTGFDNSIARDQHLTRTKRRPGDDIDHPRCMKDDRMPRLRGSSHKRAEEDESLEVNPQLFPTIHPDRMVQKEGSTK